jgi:hypothetical protein
MSARNWCLGAGALAASATGFLAGVRYADERRLRRTWRRLDATGSHGAPRFTLDRVAGLPEPARRYLCRAIHRGAWLSRVGVYRMSGEIRLGPDDTWYPMEAREILAPGIGFVWKPVVHAGRLTLSGGDYYLAGDGGQRFHLWRVLPFLRSGGPRVASSQRGRLVAETILHPAATLPCLAGDMGCWGALDEHRALWRTRIDGEEVELVLTVDDDGSLRSATVDRWTDRTPDGRFSRVPFSVEVLSEAQFGDYVLPERLRAGWELGTDREFDFFHAKIEDAVFY